MSIIAESHPSSLSGLLFPYVGLSTSLAYIVCCWELKFLELWFLPVLQPKVLGRENDLYTRGEHVFQRHTENFKFDSFVLQSAYLQVQIGGQRHNFLLRPEWIWLFHEPLKRSVQSREDGSVNKAIATQVWRQEFTSLELLPKQTNVGAPEIPAQVTQPGDTQGKMVSQTGRNQQAYTCECSA